MPTVQHLASRLASALEEATRESGETFLRLRPGSPGWMRDAVQAAHGDMMPEDWRYDFIRRAAWGIADADDLDDSFEWADSAVDVYNSALCRWLASHSSRPGYCDEAREELGEARDIMNIIQWGQMAELREVWDLIVSALRDIAEDEDEDAA